jgi:hypothetical protein
MDKKLDIALLIREAGKADLAYTVEKTILEEFILGDSTGTILQLFRFFDSVEKPLDLLEFLEFWNSLSQSEQCTYMLYFL